MNKILFNEKEYSLVRGCAFHRKMGSFWCLWVLLMLFGITISMQNNDGLCFFFASIFFLYGILGIILNFSHSYLKVYGDRLLLPEKSFRELLQNKQPEIKFSEIKEIKLASSPLSDLFLSKNAGIVMLELNNGDSKTILNIFSPITSKKMPSMESKLVEYHRKIYLEFHNHIEELCNKYQIPCTNIGYYRIDD